MDRLDSDPFGWRDDRPELGEPEKITSLPENRSAGGFVLRTECKQILKLLVGMGFLVKRVGAWCENHRTIVYCKQWFARPGVEEKDICYKKNHYYIDGKCVYEGAPYRSWHERCTDDYTCSRFVKEWPICAANDYLVAFSEKFKNITEATFELFFNESSPNHTLLHDVVDGFMSSDRGEKRFPSLKALHKWLFFGGLFVFSGLVAISVIGGVYVVKWCKNKKKQKNASKNMEIQLKEIVIDGGETSSVESNTLSGDQSSYKSEEVSAEREDEMETDDSSFKSRNLSSVEDGSSADSSVKESDYSTDMLSSSDFSYETS